MGVLFDDELDAKRGERGLAEPVVARAAWVGRHHPQVFPPSTPHHRLITAVTPGPGNNPLSFPRCNVSPAILRSAIAAQYVGTARSLIRATGLYRNYWL